MPIALITLIDHDRQFFKTKKRPTSLNDKGTGDAAQRLYLQPCSCGECRTGRDRSYEGSTVCCQSDLKGTRPSFSTLVLRSEEKVDISLDRSAFSIANRAFGEEEKIFLQLMAEEVMGRIEERPSIQIDAIPAAVLFRVRAASAGTIATATGCNQYRSS